VLGRKVSVKVLQKKFDTASDVHRRLADEARITGQLQHPAIPPVHDLGILTNGRPFLAMKLIQGETLDALLAARAGPTATGQRVKADE
jgi:serine/threonine protein kinase